MSYKVKIVSTRKRRKKMRRLVRFKNEGIKINGNLKTKNVSVK